MANTPTPRSYQSTLGDLINTFLTSARNSGLTTRALKVGGAVLSFLEAAAQSDTRNIKDIFDALDSKSLERSGGQTLRSLAADEDTEQRPATNSSGKVTIGDSSFTKIASSIYPGASAPNAGSTTIKVTDASSFPSTGQIYLGRGTANYEGPISLDSGTPPVQSGNYWVLTLSSATQRFHDLNESVILAQGGVRTVPAGQIFRTPQGNVAAAVSFSTLFSASIEDGETEVVDVDVVCQIAGTTGNVSTGAISEVVGQPFVGVLVSNPLRFTNGRPIETEAQLKERIRNLRNSKARGTDLAITTNAQGVTSKDESKTVLSATIVSSNDEPTTLYIDDGTGYEERTEAVAAETLMDSAVGGERIFQLSATRPVSKAHVTTNVTAPFALRAGSRLACRVAGVDTEHTFSTSEFRTIGNATAYEVVAAVNGNPDLDFSARTSNGGTTVTLFARTELNEDLEVVAPSQGTDANTFLAFPTAINYTLWLYRDDELQYKDGQSAVVVSQPQSFWSASITSGVALRIDVDRTGPVTYTFTDSDFVAAGTGYTSVNAANTIAAWAAVMNAKIPGITASQTSGRLSITSNRGASDSASIVITEPNATPNNLVNRGMFDAASLTATGKTKDYVLNRNKGQLNLVRPLAAGESLTVGSPFTRGYTQSSTLAGATLTLATLGARFWVVVDGAAEVIATDLTNANSIVVSDPGDYRVRYTTSANTFGNSTDGAFLREGDWVVLWDPSLNEHGVHRISNLDTSTWAWFEIERRLTIIQTTTLSKLGIAFVRSDSAVQEIHVAAGTNRSLASIADEISTQLSGAVASVYRNTHIRLTTNTTGSNGNIIVVTTDVEGRKLNLDVGTLVSSSTSHVGSIEAGNSELGTPNFGVGIVDTIFGATAFTPFPVPGSFPIDSGDMIAWNRRPPGSSFDTYGTNVGTHSSIYSLASDVLTLREGLANYNIAIGGFTRAGSVVTVSFPGAHDFQVKDLVEVWPGEADFAVGAKVVTSVTSSTLTYAEAGSAVSSTANQTAAHYRGLLPGDRLWSAKPYAVASDDTLSVTVDGNVTRSYAIEMGRRVVPAIGASYAATGLQVVDADNANQDLSDAFGTDDPDFFRDYALFMHARGVSHSITSHQAVLWRYTRMGAEGNRARISYINPTAPSQTFAVSTVNGQYTDVMIRLPSGASQGTAGLTNTTRFTVGISTAGDVDTVTYSYSAPSIAIGGLARSASLVTATTATVHGFTMGETVYLTSTDPNYAGGPKVLTAVPTTTTFQYSEAGTATPSIASATVSSAPTAPDFSALAAGTLVTISSGTSLAAGHVGTWRFTAKTTTTFSIVRLTGGITAVTIPTLINLATNLTFFTITAPTSGAVIAWVNANASDVVTAASPFNVTNTTTITLATLDEYLTGTNNADGPTSVKYWPFQDGINFVQSSDLSVSPNTLDLKNPITSSLVISGFATEAMRLVPITAAGLVRYFGSPAVSGLYASTDIKASSRNSKLQLVTNTLGSAGSIQVTGGTANSVTASVSGTGEVVDTDFSKVTVVGTHAAGLTGDQWVAVQASSQAPKTTTWGGAATVAIANVNPTSWQLTFSTDAWVLRETVTDTEAEGLRVQIDRQGRFMAYTLVDGGVFTLGQEGDWVDIVLDNASTVNTGLKQLVRLSADGATMWVENPNGVEEIFAIGDSAGFSFYSYDSAMPGDTLVIDTDTFGTLNRGSFPILALGNTSKKIIVSGDMAVLSTTALGAAAPLVRVIETSPTRLIKQIHGIGRHPDDASYAEIVFTTKSLATKMTASTGASVQPLDKLAFSTSVASGVDAYRHSTGLIGEVTKVLYGDKSNPTVYPGIVASGANINVSGPIVRRIQVSLAVRLRTGTTAKDALTRVKNAVAAAINSVDLGVAVDLAALVSAARKVDGVTAVSILSPTFDSSNDLIPIQANEKARVLDVDQDVLVTLIGQ